MKTALFFLSASPTHSVPLIPLIEEVKNKGYKIYCMGNLDEQKPLSNYDITWIEMPVLKESKNYLPKYTEVGKLMAKNPKEGLDKHIDLDLELSFDKHIDYLYKILKSLEFLKIDVIFQDAAEFYGHNIAQLLDIPCIGYITHNLYSKRYFKQSPSYLYSIMMNGLRYESLGLTINDFEQFAQITTEKMIEKRKNYFFPSTHLKQFDPLTKFTIIFSTKYLQNQLALYDSREYLLVYPDNDIMSVVVKGEDYELINFLNSKRKVIYISSGTIVSFNMYFYKKVINDLVSNGFKVVISSRFCSDLIEQYLVENGFKNKVFVRKSLNQKLVLEKACLFISHGGFNSIKESLYFSVPLFIYPITSEERLNGIEVERNLLGLTSYKKNNDESLLSQINHIIKSVEINKSVKLASEDMKNNVNNFDSLWKYIETFRGSSNEYSYI